MTNSVSSAIISDNMNDMYKEHFDITIDENKIRDDVKDIIKKIRPLWPLHQLHFKVFTDGKTNKLIGVWYPGYYTDMVLFRIYGNNTDLLIDRKNEIKNIQILNKAGYTHCIYATFNNGFAYQFLEGETLTTETVRNPEVYPLIAKRMAEMHSLKPENEFASREASIWSTLKKFMQIMPRGFSDSFKHVKFQKLIPPYTALETEYQILEKLLSKINNPIVYAHNDLLLGNILYNPKKQSVVFIDYEYTAFNYQAFDIVNHFLEFAGFDQPNYSLYPDEHFQKAWLREYLQTYNKTNNVFEKDINKLHWQINKFVPLSHFFWSCWALIQSEHSQIDFDFLEYAAIRFNEYFKWKKEIFKLEIESNN